VAQLVPVPVQAPQCAESVEVFTSQPSEGVLLQSKNGAVQALI
jgi:hypothetical protein